MEKNNWLGPMLTTIQPIDVDYDGETETKIIGDEVTSYFFTINLFVICGICSLFGIVANIINIAVFFSMGFKETINISLLGLAISDLCSLVAVLWVSICSCPFFMHSDLPLLTEDISHYPGGWTHLIFTRITSFITVYITLERCLCITFPLKIKQMMTPRRVTVVIVGIYVFIIGTMAPDYSVFYFHWKWVPSQNRSMLGASYYDHRNSVVGITFYIQMIYPILSFTSVAICTAIFVWKLNQRGKWLQSAMTGQDKTFARDQQIINLVIVVAAIFICSYIPSVFVFIVLATVPETQMGGRDQNVFTVVYSVASSLEAVNSSVNIFVYYKMMSKYKATLSSLCSRDSKPK